MKRALTLLTIAALAACAGHDPESTASSVTRAVYQDDVSAVQQSMDDTLKPQVSRAGVGVISDRMHALGTYSGLTPLATDAGKKEYTYRANFSKGSMNVVVRLDSNGALAAYRVYPQT